MCQNHLWPLPSEIYQPKVTASLFIGPLGHRCVVIYRYMRQGESLGWPYRPGPIRRWSAGGSREGVGGKRTRVQIHWPTHPQPPVQLLIDLRLDHVKGCHKYNTQKTLRVHEMGIFQSTAPAFVLRGFDLHTSNLCMLPSPFFMEPGHPQPGSEDIKGCGHSSFFIHR